jgi:hypothetical protein
MIPTTTAPQSSPRRAVELQGILSDRELQAMMCAQNIPQHIILHLTETLVACNKVRRSTLLVRALK